MSNFKVFAATVLLALAFSSGAWSKGVTVRIDISGGGLAETLEITDQVVVEQFSIWSGPRSRWRSKGGPWNTDCGRIFIDFPSGVIETPTDAPLQFDVEFHLARTPDEKPLEETYKVRYEFEPSTSGGYMYLPMGNTLISHGVEDNWFQSTEAWERAVRPLIQRSLAVGENN